MPGYSRGVGQYINSSGQLRRRGVKKRGGGKEQLRRKELRDTPECASALARFMQHRSSESDDELLLEVFGWPQLTDFDAARNASA